MKSKNRIYGCLLFFFLSAGIFIQKESILADVNHMQFTDQELIRNAIPFSVDEAVSGNFTGHSPDENTVYYKFTTDGSDSFYEIIYGGQAAKDDFLEFEWGSEYNLITKAGYVDSTGGTRHKYVGKGLEPNHTYYFMFWSWEPASYTLKIQKYEDDIADAPSGAKKVTFGQSFGGKIDAQDDQDCFVFTTESTDSFYQFDFDRSVRFSVYADKSCSERVFESKGESSGVIADKWVFEPGHTYYMIVGGAEGTYSIKVSQIQDEAGDDSTKPRKLDINTKDDKKFCLQQEWDEDWFVFETSGKTKYVLTVDTMMEPRCQNTDIVVYSGIEKASRDLFFDPEYKDALVKNIIYEEGFPGGGGSAAELTLKPYSRYCIGVFGVGGEAGPGVCLGDYTLGIREAGPSSVKIRKAGNKKIKISWGKVGDADGYEIYRYVHDEYYNGMWKKFKTIKSGKTLNYTDAIKSKNKQWYNYKVRAYRQVNGKKIYTAFTNLEYRQEIWM